jgi:hypothetical protein
MDERRKDGRDKVLFGGVASTSDSTTAECIVRNISEHGASVEFKPGTRLPKDRMALTIARTGRSFVAKIIWLRDNIVGVAFTDPPIESPKSDLEERLRKSEKKKRQLQRRIKELLGEG